MNTKQAELRIRNAMTAHFAKDKSGNYVIPIERQRPVFLTGPPGIGKTALSPISGIPEAVNRILKSRAGPLSGAGTA